MSTGTDLGSKPESQSMYRNAKGELCVGGECFILKVPDGDGPLELDLSKCSDDVKKAIGEAVMKGRPTAYDFRTRKEASK